MLQFIGNEYIYRFTAENIDQFTGKIFSPKFECFGKPYHFELIKTTSPTESEIKAEIEEKEMLGIIHDGCYEGVVKDVISISLKSPKRGIKLFHKISILKHCNGFVAEPIECTHHSFDYGPLPDRFYDDYILEIEEIKDPQNNFKKDGSIVIEARISKKEFAKDNDNNSSQSETTKISDELSQLALDCVKPSKSGRLQVSHSTTSENNLTELVQKRDQKQSLEMDKIGLQSAMIMSYMRDPIDLSFDQLPLEQIEAIRRQAELYNLHGLVSICYFVTRFNKASAGAAIMMTDKDAMAQTLLRSSKPAIVLHPSIHHVLLGKIIGSCDQSKFNVYCYCGDGWFDGKFSVYLYNHVIKTCSRRLFSTEENDVMKFMIQTHNYDPY